MTNVLRARSHQQTEADSVSGPSSYTSGDGFSVRSNLGRVDQVDPEIDNNLWEARLDSIASNNTMVFQFFSQSTSGASAPEAPDGTDFSGDKVHWTAHRL